MGICLFTKFILFKIEKHSSFPEDTYQFSAFAELWKYNVKINVKLEGVSSKDCKEEQKNIHISFIGSCIFIASRLDKLASNFM